MNANVGDTLQCLTCSHEMIITHEWLDKEVTPRVGKVRVLWLDASLIARLKCAECKSKSLRVSHADTSRPVQPAAKPPAYLCSLCGGDGGVGERCFKCSGTGFAD